MTQTAYLIKWLPHAHMRWGLYRADDLDKPIATGTFAQCHDELQRIVGSPHRYDANGNPILRGSDRALPEKIPAPLSIEAHTHSANGNGSSPPSPAGTA